MQKNQIRIISGKWRGRKLHFPDIEGLRPSPDRVRETLFNWLAPVIYDSRCLDLFAGSGALGFEALSRGAKEVVFVDSEKTVIEQIKENQTSLGCNNMQIVWSKAEDYLNRADQPFDIIFLDPPFHQNLIASTCTLIRKRNLLAEDGCLYIEAERQLALSDLPSDWNIVKQKTAGKVGYYLIHNS